MKSQYSQADLENHLGALGVKRGDVLLVHSSFKSLGIVTGGAESVIGGLESVLGSEGTLCMPGFNLCSPDKAVRAERWNIESAPSTVGYLTEYFRLLPGTLRSDHYSHSFSARGPLASYLIEGHTSSEGFLSPWDREPWGRTFGEASPLARGMAADAKVLLLGVSHQSLTYWHLVEVMDWNARRALDREAPYRWLDRTRCGQWWEKHADVSHGKVGDAACQLFPARALVRAALREVERRPGDFFKQDAA